METACAEGESAHACSVGTLLQWTAGRLEVMLWDCLHSPGRLDRSKQRAAPCRIPVREECGLKLMHKSSFQKCVCQI